MAQALPFILAAVGAVAGGASSAQKSKQASDTAKFNAAVAESNAIQQQAFADADAARARTEAVRARGEMRARAAASGVDTGTGSVIDVISDEALESELNALNIQAQGASAARASQMKAEGFKRQSKNIRRAAPLSALGAAMSGGAQGFSLGSSLGGK